MSLRTRLALLYTSIVGGILLLFGVAVYAAVSYSLVSQMRTTLNDSASAIIPGLHVDANGKLITEYPLNELVLSADVYAQLWDRNGELVDSTDNIRKIGQPMDSESMTAPT